MHVIATAGHVDHGKSTLVRALTGTDPDRLEEEHRRGLSIQLGYCWTTLPEVGDVAFVDVPGHERFISTMLTGVGPVPVTLFVVAADDPWMPQAAEHLAVLDALGVSHGVIAVTRSDLADPRPALERARAELSHTTLRDAPAVAVSGHTGQGLSELRRVLVQTLQSLPVPDADADVRLWVDRCFHVRGAGTVVTGTLSAGRIAVGDSLSLGDERTGETVRVRGMQSLGRPVDSAVGAARVALNVSGSDVERLDRSSVLVTPGAWSFTDVVDVRIVTRARGSSTAAESPQPQSQPPERPLLHIGAVSVGTHLRPLGAGLGRLTLARALPLRIGDRALLRDPGSRAVWGITVLDPAPPPLRRRGAAAARTEELSASTGIPDPAGEIRRRAIVRLSFLRRIGVPAAPASMGQVVVGDWAISADRVRRLRGELVDLVRQQQRTSPLDPGFPPAAAARALGLPSVELVRPLVAPPLRLEDGRVRLGASTSLPAPLLRSLKLLEADLADQPFAAPDAARLRELGLTAREIAAAAKAGRVLRVSDVIVLLPGADAAAVRQLEMLDQPFTTSEAREALGTTRRVALPLLEHLDRTGQTRRLPDDRRTTALS